VGKVSSEQGSGNAGPGASSVGSLRFGPYELDLMAGEIRKDGTPVKLRQQPFTVLALLASRPGHVFTRDEIQRAVWGEDTHIDFAQGINYCIKEIRAAIGDDAGHPSYVQTLARRGYRFIAPVAETSVPPPSPPPPVPRRRLALRTFLLGTALAVAAVALWPRAVQQGDGGQPARPITIAVLPFANLSGDPAHDYLSEGLTEEMIARLGRLQPGRLSVIARTVARDYEKRQGAVAALGSELRVAYVLEGSVRHSGGRIMVTARLVRTADKHQVWVESFETPLRDIIEMQSHMAREVAARINVALSPGEVARLARADRVDPEAYRLYLRGRYFWNKWSVASLRRSIQLFEEATQRQPGYALAHAGVADAYLALADQSPVDPQDILIKAKAAATRALEIDPDLAEAHASLGMVLGIHEFEWAAAERALRRSIELNPNYPTARHWYSHVLRASGRLDEALEQIRLAEDAAPLSPIVIHNLGMLRLHRDELAVAEGHFRAALELDSQFVPALLGVGRAYLQQARGAEGIAAFERAVQLSQGNARCEAALAYGYAVAGRTEEARRILARLRRQPNGRSYDIAVVQAALGDSEAALASLARAVGAKDPALRGLLVDERLTRLRAQSRWQDLALSMKLTTASLTLRNE
jgi:TolB-like protein/DNA-binding winged helix-turn-helix (wHTH) protein/tetratricopeptide (TPR) repeat protein